MAQAPLCFVVMAFGVKRDRRGRAVDFDAVYDGLLAPAIREAGFDPLRADQELVGGLIHKPMYERLILADYAIADVTTANANVFYELGVRHAVRPYSTVLVSADVKYIPFDLAPDRVVPYNLDGAGRPAAPKRDRALVVKALGAARDAKTDSPLFQLIGDLPHPEIDRLKTDVFREQAAYSAAVKARLARARTEGSGAVRAVEEDLGPLEDVEAGILIDLLLSYRATKAWEEMIRLVEAMPEPMRRTLLVREQYGLALNRAGRSQDAERELLAVLQDHGPSSETFGLLGRVYKDRWEAARGGSILKGQGYLDQAIDAYRRGFEADWRDAYPGVNAVTLMEIREPGGVEQQPLVPVVWYANRRRIEGGTPDYWDHATQLELAIIARDRGEAIGGARAALAAAREPWELESTAYNLTLIRESRAQRGEGIDWAEKIEREPSRPPGMREAMDCNDAERRALEIIDGTDASASELKDVANHLRDCDRTALATAVLTAVARRALAGHWRPAERGELAMDVLRDHQLFNYARRLLGRVRASDGDSPKMRQQHALCTYKDLELPAARRLDRALEILNNHNDLEHTNSAETLGIAGAIYKRRWDVDAKRVDLENALFYYRRGFLKEGDENHWYAGVNAAFVADRLAALEDQGRGVSQQAALREEAQSIREQIADKVTGGDGGWSDATLGEALFGLGRFEEACKPLAAVGSQKQALWRQETTAMQLAALADLHGVAEDADALKALRALVGGHAGAVQRASIGKIGLAMSGGGFRASLFHIGVLARLAECNVLRSIEVLSCVSGGSIVGAFYYLKVLDLLERKRDDSGARDGVNGADYLALVGELADEFLAGVRKNLRGRLGSDPVDDAKMLVTQYSRSDRAGELFEELFYERLRKGRSGPWRMPDLLVKPAGRGENFSLRYENWLREAKVPILVLNSTTLNTGHSWQFTASWMGEPPTVSNEPVDASQRLRRVYYADAPDVEDLRGPTLGKAVAASACVPGLFPPIKVAQLYEGVDVELVDGGVYDNQGIASLIEQDCNVILVSDASGQLRDNEDPKRWALSVAMRSNSVLMKRVRGAQYDELASLKRSGSLRGFMAVHLTKGLPAAPRDWINCQEPWDPEDDALPAHPPPAYRIDPPVQRAMAELRTDLDAFSDDEAYALMAAGYLMTKHDLKQALPSLAQAKPELVRHDWPFEKALREMTSQDASRLAESLRCGHSRFFREPRALVRKAKAWVAGLPSKLRRPWRRKG